MRREPLEYRTRRPASRISRAFTESASASGIVTIPIGTRIQTSTGIEFVTIQAGQIDTGIEDDVTLAIKAVLPGDDGNVAAGSINFFVTAVQGLSAVTNSLATAGGQEEESDDARKVRFQDFVSNLTRATRRANEVGAQSAQLVDEETEEILEQVTHARVYEPFNVTDNTIANGGDGLPASYDVGFFEIYVDNGSGTVSVELLAETQRVIDGFTEEGERVAGWKGAGIVAEVKVVTPVVVNVVCGIQMKPGFTLDSDHESLAQGAIEEYFTNLQILEKVSWENLLVAITNSSPDIYEVTLTTPAADTAVAYFERGVLGSVTINEVIP